jgi:hypothetical protein
MELVAVVVGFLLGLLGTRFIDYLSERRTASRLTKTIAVELRALDAWLEELNKRLQQTEAANQWDENSLVLTDSWFWQQHELLPLLPQPAMEHLIELRRSLYRLQSTYSDIEQDVGKDGRRFPRQHVSDGFSAWKTTIADETNQARNWIKDLSEFVPWRPEHGAACSQDVSGVSAQARFPMLHRLWSRLRARFLRLRTWLRSRLTKTRARPKEGQPK